MRAQEFVLEDKMATLTVGGMKFMVDPHILDQVVLRFVLPSDVDRILKKMSTIRPELDAIEPGQQFWVYSPTLDVAVGMRKGLSGSFLLKTALANRPWQSDTPTLTVQENFADGKVKGKSRPGRVKRAGASCKGSVTDLRARAKKYGGERGKMYQWCLNMKAGKQKKSK